MSTVAGASVSELAQALFVSALQESHNPSPQQVRMAVERCTGAVDCLGCVAQEAGDHPEAYATRMQWALHAVMLAYRTAA